MRRFLLVLLLASVHGPAHGAGHFTLPLPAPDLPVGSLTVKVTGDGMQDKRVGQAVSLFSAGGPQEQPLEEARTGEDGRARFEGLTPGAKLVIVVKRGDQIHRSKVLTVPASGGLRMLLSMGGSTAMPRRSSGGRMPAGHPQLPGGSAPRPAGAAEITPDPGLGDGELRVKVHKGSKRLPARGIEVRLSQRGPGTNKIVIKVRTDAAGEATLTLPSGGGDFVLSAAHGGLTFGNRAFSAPSKGGLRATFQVYDRTTDPTRLQLAAGTHWVCQVGERVVRFMQVLQLSTSNDMIVDLGKGPGLTIPLPAGAQGVELPKDLKGVLALDPQTNSLRLQALIPPTGLTARVYYTLPYRGEQLDFSQRLPLALPRSLVSVVGNDEVRIEGPSIAGPANRSPDQGSQQFPMEAQSAGGTVEFTLSGLPHHDTRPRTLALLVAGLIVLWGLIAAIGGPGRARWTAKRREQLLALLQRGRGAKKRAGKDARRREEAMDELRQLWNEPW